MPEIASADKQQLISKIERFFERNASENITRYVLGSTKISRCVKRMRDVPAYFNNIFSLAFIFAYGCLRCDNDSEEPQNLEFTKQNSLRIVNSLKKAYVQYPVTFELVQFVLSDIQFEMLQSEDKKIEKVFGRICNFRKMQYSLSKYYKVIAEWRAAPSRFMMDEVELLQMFYNLLQNMTFLREYDLVADNTGAFSFIDKEALEFDDLDQPYACVPARHIIYYTDSYMNMFSLYSLEKLETDEGNKLNLVYVSGDGFNSLTFTVSEGEAGDGQDSESHINEDASDYYYAITGEDWDNSPEQEGKRKNVNFIDQVHTINYKYIKNLALSISDAISTNRGTKSALYSAYHRRYKDIFKEVEELLVEEPNIERIKLDWDGIVVMLLIESSPTSVLETLFKANQQTFVAVAENLSKRIDSPDLAFFGKDGNELDTMVNDIIHTKLVVGETGGFGRIPRNPNDERLRARAEALLIVSSLSSIHEEAVEKSICAGNIYDNIGLLRKIRNEYAPAQRMKYVCFILGETFRHLLCFYRGLLGYGELKVKFDAEYSRHFFSDVQINSEQKKMQRAFMKAATAEAEELKQFSSLEYDGIYAMLHRFMELCEDCSSSAKNTGAYSRSLFATLGKHDLLNLAEFRAYVDQFTAKYYDITEENVDNWITFALDLLRYLRKGSFKSTEETPFKAIYPFAATYNKGNENYDGYRTVTFTLNFDIDGDDQADGSEYINVLTEFSYSTTNVFYCLPNVLRSNKRWWIDPLLVGFKEFNDIFEE